TYAHFAEERGAVYAFEIGDSFLPGKEQRLVRSITRIVIPSSSGAAGSGTSPDTHLAEERDARHYRGGVEGGLIIVVAVEENSGDDWSVNDSHTQRGEEENEFHDGF